jgi:hypothetical protein
MEINRYHRQQISRLLDWSFGQLNFNTIISMSLFQVRFEKINGLFHGE